MSPLTRTVAPERPRTSATAIASPVALDLLAALAARGMAGHAGRVFKLSARVCRRLGMAERPAAETALGALLHDVGKLGVDDDLLDHPGPLSDEGRAAVREHPAIGERALRDNGLHGIAPLVRHSHERWDGLGYPDGLMGVEIPLGARVIAACDTWDALTSDRPYQRARTRDEAITELVDAAGSQLDPTVVAALISEITRAGLT